MSESKAGWLFQPMLDPADWIVSLQHAGRVIEPALEGDLFVTGIEIFRLEDFQNGSSGTTPQDVGHGRAVDPGDGRCAAGHFHLLAEAEPAAIDNVKARRGKESFGTVQIRRNPRAGAAREKNRPTAASRSEIRAETLAQPIES